MEHSYKKTPSKPSGARPRNWGGHDWKYCTAAKFTSPPFYSVVDYQEHIHTAKATKDSEEVSGIRCIWGTIYMRSCTSRAVLATLQRLSKISEKFQVCRKFKKRDNGALQWWFLIRGDEADLLVLDQEWEAVQIQTSWKLERCHKPVTQESGEKDTSFLGHD